MLSRRALLAAPALAVAQTKPRRPNVLVVVMDDFGVGQFAPLSQDMSVEMFDPAYVKFLREKKVTYEPAEALEMSQRAMPTLTAMAKQGTVFSKAVAPSNLCSPARAGILTGQNPNRFGVYNNIDFQKTGLPKGSILVDRLQRAGYATAMIGKYHVGTQNVACGIRSARKESRTASLDRSSRSTIR